MGACNLPGVGTVCNTVGGVVTDAAGSVFDAAVGKLTEGFANATRMVVTFWTGVDVPGLETTTGPVAVLRGNTSWLTAFIAVLSVLVCAARLALTRSGRPAGEAFKGLIILVLVSGCGVAAVNALTVFGDSYSRWVLERSTDGQLGTRMATLATLGAVSGLGTGLMLIIAVLGTVASLAQMGLMLVRVGVVTIFAGLLPLAAAGTSTQTGMEFFKRILAWLLAFVLYKPAAATVYASAFLLLGDGHDATSVLSGVFMLVLSIVALPAMLRLITPMVGAAVAAGAGAGGGMAAAGMVLATGARMSSGTAGGRAPPPASGAGSAGLLPGGAGPAGGAGSRGRTGGGGSDGPSANSASAGSPALGAAGAGRAGAGGAAAAGPVMQAGAQLLGGAAAAAKGAAAHSTAGLDGQPGGASRPEPTR